MLTLPLWLRSTDKNICEWNKTSKEEQWFRSLKKGSCTYTVKVRQSFHISVSDYVAHTDTHTHTLTHTHRHTHTPPPQHSCWIYLDELLGCTEACQPTATHTEIHTHMHRHTFSVSHTHTHTTHTQTPQHNYWIYLDELLGCIEACWPTAHYRHLGMVNTVAAQPPATQRPQHAHASQWQPLTQCPHLFVPTVILWTRMMRMFSKKHLLYFYFFYKLCSLSLAHSYLFMQWTLHKD